MVFNYSFPNWQTIMLSKLALPITQALVLFRCSAHPAGPSELGFLVLGFRDPWYWWVGCLVIGWLVGWLLVGWWFVVGGWLVGWWFGLYIYVSWRLPEATDADNGYPVTTTMDTYWRGETPTMDTYWLLHTPYCLLPTAYRSEGAKVLCFYSFFVRQCNSEHNPPPFWTPRFWSCDFEVFGPKPWKTNEFL